jgi:hypothetical protein
MESARCSKTAESLSEHAVQMKNVFPFNFDTIGGILTVTFTLHCILWTNVLNRTRYFCSLYVIISHPTVRGRTELSLRMCYRFSLPLPPTCVFVTVDEALSYFASTVDTNVSQKHTVSIFRAENGDSMFLRNVGIYLRDYTAPEPRRSTTSPSCHPLVTYRVSHSQDFENTALQTNSVCTVIHAG